MKEYPILVEDVVTNLTHLQQTMKAVRNDNTCLVLGLHDRHKRQWKNRMERIKPSGKRNEIVTLINKESSVKSKIQIGYNTELYDCMEESNSLAM